MNDTFNRGMAAATRLTQAGKLADATALIQRLLGSAPGGAVVTPSALVLEAPLIDATALEPAAVQDGVKPAPVLPGPNVSLRGLIDRLAPLAKRSKVRPAATEAELLRAPGQFIAGSFTNDAGTRPYKLYVPIVHDGGPRPLVVMLHGCTQSPDDFAAGTRMNVCAEEHECFVVYPEQTSSANPSKCWNWFNASEQVRDRGEPSIIAGLTRDIMKTHAVDPRRVYVAGLSAGGAAAAVLGEAYPDLYAAIGVHSGLAYGAARDMSSAFAAMGGQSQQLPPRAGKTAGSFVPTIVFHGDRDSTVHPRNGAAVVARAGELNELQSMTETSTAAGRTYTRSLYRDAKGYAVMEDWVIHGAGHAWSGGSKAGSFTDSQGPDASREMLRFFLAHAMNKKRK